MDIIKTFTDVFNPTYLLVVQKYWSLNYADIEVRISITYKINFYSSHSSLVSSNNKTRLFAF